MDRNAILGFILIGLVLMVWLYISAPPPTKHVQKLDTLLTSKQNIPIDTVKQLQPRQSADTLGKYFSHLGIGKSKTLIIETDKYISEISTQGASVKSWKIKEYKTWDKHPLDLINTTDGGDFNLMFYTSDGKLINTKYLFFHLPFNDAEVVKVGEGDSLSITYVLEVSAKSRIVKKFIFHAGKFSFDVEYSFQAMEQVISNFQYQVVWESGLRFVEYNSVDESNYSIAAALSGGELTEVDATNFNEIVSDSLSGRVSWIATRNKYFAVAIIPRLKESQGAYLEGKRSRLPHEGTKEDYSIALEMPFTGRSLETDKFTVFVGPLDFDIIKGYDVELDRIMSLGAAWIIRPISEYFIIPLFKFLKLFIPNYGVILILFSIIIKVILHPLSKSSLKSMQKMQALQPMMNELREKYKSDPQKMNQQVMRLYKEYGVNPAGGCFPILLQLPILYALWVVFSSTIELRQAPFIWWIKDLSMPDVIVSLPFRIPIFNINEISGLALLMGITMFFQQKMSIKDPRQKMMVWLMPIMLTLLFNAFPSGLNLYYFIFNLLAIAQQAWITKKHKGEPLRKVESKKTSGGWISRIAKDLPMKKK